MASRRTTFKIEEGSNTRNKKKVGGEGRSSPLFRKRSVVGHEHLSFLRRKKNTENDVYLGQRKKSVGRGKGASGSNEIPGSQSLFDLGTPQEEVGGGRKVGGTSSMTSVSSGGGRGGENLHRIWSTESLYIREVGEGSGSMLRRGASTGGLRSRMKASLFSRRREAVLPFRDLEEVTEAASISPSQVYLRGEAIIRRNRCKQTTKKWLVLAQNELVSFDSEQESPETKTALCSLGTVSYLDMGVILKEYLISLHLASGKEISLTFDCEEVASKWALAIDTIMSNNLLRRVLPQTSRDELTKLHLQTAKSGILKRVADDEEWEYQDNNLKLVVFPSSCPSSSSSSSSSSSLLIIEDGQEEMVTNYEWDGSCLIPCRAEGGKSALWGHWDGAVVRVKKKDLCLLKWVYIPDTRQYLSTEEGEEKSWKWSRHFLASKNGSSSSWLMEGTVPEPIAMILQGLRYASGKDTTPDDPSIEGVEWEREERK